MENIVRAAISPVYCKRTHNCAHGIHKSIEKQYSLERLEAMTLRTLKTRWIIWMIFCPYTSIACKWSVCWVCRKGLITSSMSICRILEISEKTDCVYESLRLREFQAEEPAIANLVLKKKPEGGLTSYWKAARQKPPRRNSGCQRQQS